MALEPVCGEGDVGPPFASFPVVDVESGEITDKCVEEAERRGVKGTTRAVVAELSILVLLREYIDVVRAMRVDPVMDGVLPGRVFRGVVGIIPAEPPTGVVVTLSRVYLGKLPGGAEIRRSPLKVRFGNTGIGTGTGCSGFIVGDDMVNDVDNVGREMSKFRHLYVFLYLQFQPSWSSCPLSLRLFVMTLQTNIHGQKMFLNYFIVSRDLCLNFLRQLAFRWPSHFAPEKC